MLNFFPLEVSFRCITGPVNLPHIHTSFHHLTCCLPHNELLSKCCYQHFELGAVRSSVSNIGGVHESLDEGYGVGALGLQVLHDSRLDRNVQRMALHFPPVPAGEEGGEQIILGALPFLFPAKINISSIIDYRTFWIMTCCHFTPFLSGESPQSCHLATPEADLALIPGQLWRTFVECTFLKIRMPGSQRPKKLGMVWSGVPGHGDGNYDFERVPGYRCPRSIRGTRVQCCLRTA